MKKGSVIDMADTLFLTSAQVAEKLQLNQQVVVRKLQTGEIPGYKLGKDWRVSDHQLIAWLESKSNQNRPDARAKVERSFFKAGRLVEIPAQRKKRVVVLERLLAEFEPERVYAESEVNAILRRFHPDFCTLRRELVDGKMMVRANGKYRRTGAYKMPKVLPG